MNKLKKAKLLLLDTHSITTCKTKTSLDLQTICTSWKIKNNQSNLINIFLQELQIIVHAFEDCNKKKKSLIILIS